MNGTTWADSGFVYFVQCVEGGAIKIGYSVAPEGRLYSFQPHCPFELRLLGYFRGSLDDERALHGRFNALRIRFEWFAPSTELLAFIHERCGKAAA